MNNDPYDRARLQRELTEALCWDELIVEGVVEAIFSAADTKEVEDIVSNFMLESEAGRNIVTDFLASREKGQDISNPATLARNTHTTASSSGGPDAPSRQTERESEKQPKQPSPSYQTDAKSSKKTSTEPPKGMSRAVHGVREMSSVMQRPVVNCIGCGKIYDSRKQTEAFHQLMESGGKCGFCGKLINLRSGDGFSDSQEPDSTAAPDQVSGKENAGEISEAEKKALEFKNRLVDYDRNSAKRTTVLDDQSDYFEIETNVWLEENEKDELRRRRELEEEVANSLRQKVRYTIDLLGRRVFVSEDPKPTAEAQIIADAAQVAARSTSAEKPQGGGTGAMAASQTASWLSNDSNGPNLQFRVPINPDIQTLSPIFLPSQAALDQSIKQRQPPLWIQGYKGRLQHDDVFFAFDDSVEPEVLAADLTAYAEFFDQFDNRPFDLSPEVNPDTPLPIISLPKTHPVISANARQSSMLFTTESSSKPVKQIPRVEAFPDGFILLKNWLSFDEQLRIVEAIRNIGIGPGGFYTPIDKYKSEMKIKMMCLGWNWNPIDRLYEKQRTNLDNAPTPEVPPFLFELTRRCILDANRLRGEAFPDIDPNVCICNYYGQDSSLSLHQDSEEGEESLKRQIPVVSFSIGATGEFVFNRVRSLDTAQSVMLESGDALVFGGPSRMLFHGIHRVFIESMPPELTEMTGMRAGRLNLTLRQYIP